MAKRTNASERTKGTAVAIATMVGGLVGIQPALGQDAEPLPVDIGECVDLESAEERFACYESRANAALRTLGRTGPAAAPEGRAADLPASAGATDLPAPKADRSAATPAGELVGTIQSLRETVPNSYLITLENGQVWRQMRPERYPLQIGYQVKIYPTRWGQSYRLTADELNGFIQVERIR